jgi:hypothetical protein
MISEIRECFANNALIVDNPRRGMNIWQDNLFNSEYYGI